MNPEHPEGLQQPGDRELARVHHLEAHLNVARHPAPDVTIDRIGDLTAYDMPALLDAARQKGTR